MNRRRRRDRTLLAASTNHVFLSHPRAGQRPNKPVQREEQRSPAEQSGTGLKVVGKQVVVKLKDNAHNKK